MIILGRDKKEWQKKSAVAEEESSKKPGSLQSSLGRDKRVASEMGSNKRALLRPGFKVKILFQCSSSMKEEGYEKKMETQYQEQAGMSKSRYQEQHWNQPMIMQ
jgi:hypothetical protein